MLTRPVQVPALQQFVNTVIRQESTVGKSPAAVFVITNEMIRRNGATSIPEALRMAPGLSVARIDANKWAVSVRGFNDRFASKLLVQVDGRVVYNQLTGGVYWDVPDVVLQDVERIEVIRGPGATVWGSNAVNGIINIITKNSKETQGLLIAAGGGTEDKGITSVRYGGQVDVDGFEATAAIRAHEQVSGGHVPIIAMTAHAMKGDRERCLAAGMDGYVATPLQAQELFEVVEGFFGRALPNVENLATRPEESPFDLADALRHVDGDKDLLKELLQLFAVECPQLLASIRKAIDHSDAVLLRRAAHSLKGAVSNFGAPAVVAAAQHLESLGHAGNLVEAPAASVRLQETLDRVQPDLDAIASS